MMQTETEKHLMTIRTNESNIERQRTEIVSLYSQIQQLQGMSGIKLSAYTARFNNYKVCLVLI